MSYTLQNLWNASQSDIQRILIYFNHPITNNITDRLSAIILSFNNNLLNPDERKYVSSPLFNQLVLANDDQLKVSSQRSDLDHIDMVKVIIDYHSIPTVNEIPPSQSAISIYQIDDRIYVCGKGTYPIKEELKSLAGSRWDSQRKCWSFPLASQLELIQTLHPRRISVNIPQVDIIPRNHPGDLQVYQLGNRIFVCGRETINIKNSLSKLTGANFDYDTKCWNFPSYVHESVLNIVDTHRNKMKDEPARLQRMRIPEPEISYIPKSDIRQDIAELRLPWQDKIRIVRTQSAQLYNTYIVTYDGDFKPPDIALMLAAVNWTAPYFTWNVKKVDHKTYEVTVWNN